MNLSRGPERPVETAQIPVRRDRARRLWLGASGLVIAIIGWQWFRVATRPDPEPWLAEARQLFALMAADTGTHQAKPRATAPLNPIQKATRLLEQYLSASGRETESAKLLLRAASATSHPDRSKSLLDEVRLSDCPAADLNHAALLYFIAQRHESASRLIDTALARSDSRVQTLRTAALMRFDLGLTEDVLTYCREWSRLAPLDPEPWRLMCYVYDDRGATELAAITYRNLLERSPDEPGARQSLVDKLIQLGEPQAAREQFDLIPDVERLRTPESQLTAARLFSLEGRVDAALSQLAAVLHSDPNHSAALLLQGKILLSKSDLMPAITALKRSLQKDPTSLDGHYLLGQAYARAGDERNASQHLAEHERLRSTRVLINSLEIEAARKPQDVAIRRRLVDLYNSIGLFQQALFWTNAAATMRPGQHQP